MYSSFLKTMKTHFKQFHSWQYKTTWYLGVVFHEVKYDNDDTMKIDTTDAIIQ